MKEDLFLQYRKIVGDADNDCHKLEQLHKNELACKKGCTSCCMDFGLLPVEFHAIAEALKNTGFESRENFEEGECPMLVDGLCSIYPYRPFICRSHGLPLLAMGEEGWELSHCELNFLSGTVTFDESNTLPHDRYNSRLFMLNLEFIKNYKGKKYRDSELVPLSRLPAASGLSDQRQ